MQILVLYATVLLASCANSLGPAVSCRMQDQYHVSSDQRAAGVDTRGDQAMGFSHETAAHHFALLPDGGVIEVQVKDAHDDATRNEIRSHLTHIAAMFSAGDFEMPMFIHDRVPPGVPVMKQKHEAITYQYEQTECGGMVRIRTLDPDALKAVHEFLVFQIQDHHTGDPQK
jgi:hypothetical protein